MSLQAGVSNAVSAASQARKYHRLSPELPEQIISIYRTMFPHNTVRYHTGITE
jgi:hypothetical protein